MKYVALHLNRKYCIVPSYQANHPLMTIYTQVRMSKIIGVVFLDRKMQRHQRILISDDNCDPVPGISGQKDSNFWDTLLCFSMRHTY